MHRTLKKMTKLERAQVRRQKLENAMSGTGRYIFQNNTSGELDLPKKPIEIFGVASGNKKVMKDGKFIGDSYFMQMVKSHDLKLIEELKEPVMSDEKLIIEQPPTVTSEGAVEFIKSTVKLNENQPKSLEKDILLTEDPISGVVIID